MMSRYTGRSLVFIVLRLCFVVAIVYAVRDSTLLIALSHRKGASLVTRFQQPGGKICLRIDDDGWNRWWENDLFFYFSLNVDLNFNSLDVSFFFLMRWICFLFDDFAEKISLWMFVLLWGTCDDGLMEENERQFCPILWISRFFYFVENDLADLED